MMMKKMCRELGEYKIKIQKALYTSDSIKDVLLGQVDGKSQTDILRDFKHHVKSHLFIDETVTETDTFIFYDIRIPTIRDRIKDCTVVMYLICHRDILETYEADGYYGNRIDILTQMVEDTLLSEDAARSYGIGPLQLTGVDIYSTLRFYGRVLTFNVPDFR